jgi:Family of unknown function (DUF6165)
MTQAFRLRAVRVEISAGELLDKLTILDIKRHRITEPAKLRHVEEEWAALNAARDRDVPPSEELTVLAEQLRAVNEALWDVEDELRRCEQAADFGPRFIDLARSVYRHNDRRAALKQAINALLGSAFFEEKSYRTEAPRPPS